MTRLHKILLGISLLSVVSCRPMSEDAYSNGGSSLMGVAPTGRTAISGSIKEALAGYTGTVNSGQVYVGGGYGGNGLAGQMHCKISSGPDAWLTGCNNVTTQGFLAPGTTFSSGGSQSLWSWKESSDRIMRIIGGSDSLTQNPDLASSSVNDVTQNDQGEKFENLMDSNDDYFKSLGESRAPAQDFDTSGYASGLGLTANSDSPKYNESAASKLTSLKCQVGSKTSTFNDVVEVVLRKGSAVLNAYFAKGLGYVGYKYVRSGNGGGTGTNILVCVDPSGSGR